MPENNKPEEKQPAAQSFVRRFVVGTKQPAETRTSKSFLKKELKPFSR